jgi:acetyl-CoA carboxylase, biotin carboxylase subunit
VGTVEFLVDPYDNFYFIEMNTRLQVEHPVTEQSTKIDIVKEQIKISFGEKMSFVQKDIKLYDHAIECRINAEDPSNNFYPSPGIVKNFTVPGGFNLRVDSHVHNNYVISSFYDSMIAKLISFNKSKLECIHTLSRALREVNICGIKTNTRLCQNIIGSKMFSDKLFRTNTLDLYLKNFLY